MSKCVGSVAKALVVSYLVSVIVLLLLALFQYKCGQNDTLISCGITFLYIFSTAVGGLVAGKSIGKKRFLWGLIVGTVYAMILCVVSLVFFYDKNMVFSDGLSTVLLCMCGGILGGMIS